MKGIKGRVTCRWVGFSEQQMTLYRAQATRRRAEEVPRLPGVRRQNEDFTVSVCTCPLIAATAEESQVPEIFHPRVHKLAPGLASVRMGSHNQLQARRELGNGLRVQGLG